MQCQQCGQPLRHDPAAQKLYCDNCRLAYPVNQAPPPTTTPAIDSAPSTAQPQAPAIPHHTPAAAHGPAPTRPPAASRPPVASGPHAPSAPSSPEANPVPPKGASSAGDSVFKIAMLLSLVTVIALLVSQLAINCQDSERQARTQSLGSVISLENAGSEKGEDVCVSSNDWLKHQYLYELMWLPLLESGWRQEGGGGLGEHAILRYRKRLELPCAEALIQVMDPNDKLPQLCRRAFLRNMKCRACYSEKGKPPPFIRLECMLTEKKGIFSKKFGLQTAELLGVCLVKEWRDKPKSKKLLAALEECLKKKTCRDWTDCVDATVFKK